MDTIENPELPRTNTDWFRDMRWGLFFHYLADTPSETEPATMGADEWNRRVDSFNIPRFIGQIKRVGARYIFLTIGQNSGFYCSPNGTYDALLGERPSRLSHRDLVGELADSLEGAGIRFMAYLPSLAPSNHRLAIERLKCTPKWDGSKLGIRPGTYKIGKDVDEKLSQFQRNWEAIIKEWSLRWGRKVHGWWIDGCYESDKLYRHPDPPNFSSFASALKAGNPDAIVAFNSGVNIPIATVTEYEDFTAGELSGALPLGTLNSDRNWYPVPLRRWVGGAQLHALCHLGEWWGCGHPRMPDELVKGFTKLMNLHDGVITWDVPISAEGHISEAFVRQLECLDGTQHDGPD